MNFKNTGYTNANALDICTNVAAKVLSNTANQLAMNITDEQIEPFTKGLAFDANYR